MKSKTKAQLSGAAVCLMSVFAATELVHAQGGVVPTKPHPAFDLINFRPSTFKPKVTGMGWLSDGTLVIAHWGGIHQKVDTRQLNSVVYFVKGATGPNPTNVQVSTFAEGLEDLMGLEVVNDRIFVCGGNKVIELLDENKDGVSEKQRLILELPGEKARHEFLFGLLHKDGILYAAASSPKMDQDPPDKCPNKNRGQLLAINEKTGAFTAEAMGLRTPNGMGWGLEGDIWISDVQGNWLPSCKLIHVKKGAFYGFKHTPRETWDDNPETPPAVYMPQTELANAPGQPLVVRSGLYAGHILVGDVTQGGVQRYFVEKVNGEYQGAGFHFLGGLEAGIERLTYGPDGMIYLGGAGDIDGNWHWQSKVTGLQKINPNGTTTFEMLAIRSLGPTSMEIEFTEPMATGMEATTNFTIRQWKYTPTIEYGGSKIDSRALTVSKATPSADRKKVTLEIAGLMEGYMLSFRLNTTMKSSTGKALWTPEGWYTLNKFGPGASVVPISEAHRAGSKGYGALSQSRFTHAFGAVDQAVRLIANRRDAMGRAH